MSEERKPDVEKYLARATVTIDLLEDGQYHMVTAVKTENKPPDAELTGPESKVTLMANLLIECFKVVLAQHGTIDNAVAWVNRCSAMALSYQQMLIELQKAGELSEEDAEPEPEYQPESIKFGG